MNYEFETETSHKSEQNIVAAIDIGTTKIVAIVGTKDEKGRIKILGLGESPSLGVKRGVVQNIEEASRAIRKAADDAEKQSGIKIEHVVVGIAGQHIRSIKNRGYIMINDKDNEIKQKHVDALIEQMHQSPLQSDDEILHVIPQSFTVDNETGITSNVVGMNGHRLEGNFHIVLGQTASAKKIQKSIERAGLILDSMVLEPLASSEAVLSDDDKEAGVAMIDIGGGTTDIAIFYDKIVRHTAVIPWGGAIITQDIKEGLKIVERKAERMKVQFGFAIGSEAPKNELLQLDASPGQAIRRITTQQLSLIIQARMEEIIEAINFEIENSGYAQKLGNGIVITGGGALLKSLPQLFSFHSGNIVRVGRPNDVLVTDYNEISDPKYSTSVGLVLKAVEYYEKEGYKKSVAPTKTNDESMPKKEKQVEFQEEEIQGGGIVGKLKGFFDGFFGASDSEM
jgi:cell division protein FtsA